MQRPAAQSAPRRLRGLRGEQLGERWRRCGRRSRRTGGRRRARSRTTLSRDAVDLAERAVEARARVRQNVLVLPRGERGQHGRGERLVDLEEVEVLEGQPVAGEQPRHRVRAGAMSSPSWPCTKSTAAASASTTGASDRQVALGGPRRWTRAGRRRRRRSAASSCRPSSSRASASPVPNTGLSFASFSSDVSARRFCVAGQPAVRGDEVVEEAGARRRRRGSGGWRARPRPAPRG